jgi:hypothetical protein
MAASRMVHSKDALNKTSCSIAQFAKKNAKSAHIFQDFKFKNTLKPTLLTGSK